MDRKIKERLELALKSAKPPTLEEVFEQVSRRGVLRGPVDWVFPAWMLYVEYVTQKIAETFQLTEEEKRQLFHFRDALTRLLQEARAQAKAKLMTLYKAVIEGTYRVEGNRLYAPDWTWMRIAKVVVPRITIHGVTAKTRFPDVLKLPREKLELLQLGWRASDESHERNRPFMATAQPWQVFSWTAVRYGELRIRIASVNLTHEGASVLIHIVANSWRQKWGKAEAVDLVASHLKRGEWTPIITAWLGDGQIDRKKVLRGDYQLVIAAKEPWRLGISVGTGKALVATGRETFLRLREAAGVYGVLFDVLKAHKWIYIKLATDDVLRLTHRLNRKRGIDVLREAYGQNSDEIPTASHAEADKPGAVAVAGVAMYLELVSGRGGSLVAKYFTRDLGKAFAVAGKLESAGLRPNIVRSNANYVVYIATADLIKLAERDETIRKAVALYLAEKAKNGTPRQREIAEKLLKRHPLFYYLIVSPPSRNRHRCVFADIELQRRA
jgi:hypothetical protein